jgi:hypothetical protein
MALSTVELTKIKEKSAGQAPAHHQRPRAPARLEPGSPPTEGEQPNRQAAADALPTRTGFRPSARNEMPETSSPRSFLNLK